MKIKLNDNELECNNIFWTADTHFNQERTRVLSKRPFDNTHDMNNVMIDNWNKTVGIDDIVIHQGDFGEPEFFKYLNGRIYFMPAKTYDTDGIVNDLINLGAIILSQNSIVEIDDIKLQMVHEPLSAEKSDNFFLFGHIHKLQMVKKNGLCVSQDSHNFTPISLETVLFYKNAIENHYDENVFVERLG